MVVSLVGATPGAYRAPMDELPGAMLRWIEAAAGDGSRIVSARPMERASAEMHEIVLDGTHGAASRLVLRRYADRSRLGTDPFYDPANEARALRLLDGSGVPAPRLVAADLAPDVCDVPALLESWLRGASADPRDVDGYLRSAAEELVRIHAAVPVRPEGLPDYVSYAVADGLELRPPAWTTRPGLWERVLEVVAAEPPETRTCFIHRDYHLGNTLTVDDRVVSVVDWPTAAWGPPGIDLARMRLNLVEEVTPASADAFLVAYRAAGGDPDDRHPYWDLRDAADCLIESPSGGSDIDDHDKARFETWVASALGEL
jgi:aminoglycoside phosphotransferase (APT) family kinase protein